MKTCELLIKYFQTREQLLSQTFNKHHKTPIHFNTPKNLTYHNLCTKLVPPSGLGRLLGLVSKIIIQKKRPNLKLDESLDDLIIDVRLKYHFADEKLINDDFHP